MPTNATETAATNEGLAAVVSDSACEKGPATMNAAEPTGAETSSPSSETPLAEASSVAASGRVLAVCLSERKGVRKKPVDSIKLEVGSGVVGDAHAGSWHRQVSLLPNESVDELRGVLPALAPGDFAENVLTEGLDLKSLPVGTVLAVGEALVAVTQIGKKCHNDCEIKRLVGKCAMPSEGIFAVVIRDGAVRRGDGVRVVEVCER